MFVPFQLIGADPEVLDVFVPKVDGFASIRIPSVVTSNSGTVLAFAEGRAADADQARNRLILKRSMDGGKTWSKAAVIAEDGDKALNNPCAVVERETGVVLLMYQSYPAGLSERSGTIQPGLDGEKIIRNWLVTSRDDGATWSKPRDITKSTKREKVVTTIAGGPGIGIQLRNGRHAGRILFPFNEGPFGVWNIYAVYSDDKGATWKRGDAAPGGLVDNGKDKKSSLVNEAQFVELADGSIRFNVRRWAGKAVRKTCVSKDGGATWSKIEDAPDLVDPGCMASVLRYTDPSDGARSRILFSGPQSSKRENGTIFVSYDEGATWPTKRVLCKGSFAYSCLTALKDGTIGCLYETGTKIVFARLTLEWLTDGKDKLSNLSPTPLPLELIRPSRDRTHFTGSRSGKRFVVWGVNYDRDDTGRLLEDYWENEWGTVIGDFREMKALGVNVVRIHLQFGRFMDAPDRANKESLARLGKLVRLSESIGLYLDVTGLGCYHKQDVPAWYDKLCEAARWDAQAEFWKAVARVCKDSPAVFCYDLMNEPVLAGDKKNNDWLAGELSGKFYVQRITRELEGRTGEEVARQWVKKLADAIRKVDDNHMITVGVIPWAQVFKGAKPLFYAPGVGDPLDFVSVHLYPRSKRLDDDLAALKVYEIGKPLLVEEIFPLGCSIEEAEAFIDRSASHCDGWISFYWGRTVEEYEKENDIKSALLAKWLRSFRAKGPEVLKAKLDEPPGSGAVPAAAFTIPTIDLNDQKERFVLVDREPGQYLGHPTTLLLEDGKTILCVYPKGHGRGPILYKRSTDGGKTWSARLSTPKSWETSLETPTLHRVVDANGRKRVILFSGLYPCRMAVSEDDGQTWSELNAVGDWGGIVTMSSLVELKSGAGHYVAFFHDDGRFIRKGGKLTSTSTVYRTNSTDGGLTWSKPESICASDKVFLCEPCAIRSPDGRQIAVLMRENFHIRNTHIILSDDEGRTWTEPRELAASLNGDRHVAKYGPDGRLFVSFRDFPIKGQFSSTAGDWVGWVGTYDDLVKGKEGQYRIRLRRNFGNSTNSSIGDCGYSGVELLPDGTFVAVAYGHWDVVAGSQHPRHPDGRGQPPYLLCVRFSLKDVDELAEKQPAK